MTTDKPDLLPCPFCDVEMTFHPGKESRPAYVGHPVTKRICILEGQSFLLSGWNTRPQSPDIARLRAQVGGGDEAQCSHCKGTGSAEASGQLGMSSDDSKCWWCQGTGTCSLPAAEEGVIQADRDALEAKRREAFLAADLEGGAACGAEYCFDAGWDAMFRLRFARPSDDGVRELTDDEAEALERQASTILAEAERTCLILHPVGKDVPRAAALQAVAAALSRTAEEPKR